MNQSIQFPDREIWNIQESCLIFPALVNGIVIDCCASFSFLKQFFGQELTIEQLKVAFSDNRWDIEDMAETLIKNQDYSCDGYIILK